MADLLHLKTLSDFPSPFLKPRSFSSLPLNFNLFPLRGRLSLFPTLSSAPNSSNLLLISTSLNSDGSVVFKFGDASEMSPIVDDGGIEVDSGTNNDAIVAGHDDGTEADYQSVSNAENVVDGVIEVDSGSKSDDDSNHSVSNAENVVDDVIEADYQPVSNVVNVNCDGIEADYQSVSNVEIVDDDGIEADYQSVSNAVNVNYDGIEADYQSVSNVEIVGDDGNEADYQSVSNVVNVNYDGIEADYQSVSNAENVVDEGIEADYQSVSNVMNVEDEGIEADLRTKCDAIVAGDDESSRSVSNVEIVNIFNTDSDDDATEVGLEIESYGNLAVNDQEAHFVSNVENDAENDIETEDSEMELLESKVIAKESAPDSAEDEHNNHHVGNFENDVEDDIEAKYSETEFDNKTNDSPIKVKSGKEIAQELATDYVKGEQNCNFLVVALGVEDSKLDVITESGFDEGNLDSEVALEGEEINDEETVVEVTEEATEMVPVQLEEEPILDDEVNDAGLSSTGGLEDSPAVDIADSISVSPNLEEPVVTATVAIADREDISARALYLVSAAASLAHSAEALAGGDDAYFVYENWFGVADGVGQWSFEGIDKGLYAQQFIQNCECLARKNLNTGLHNCKQLLQQTATMTESSGAARVLIAHIADQVLHVANIGDAGFIIIRNGTVFKKSSPMFHEFNFPFAIISGENPVEPVEEYHVELQEGDIIVLATDGLFDNLYQREIASLVCNAVQDGKSVKDIAELLASRSQEVGRSPYARTPFADAAQEAGHPEFSGGKFDLVTVIVSVVQKEQVPSSRKC